MAMQLQTLPIFFLVGSGTKNDFLHMLLLGKIRLGYKKTAIVIHLCIPKGSFLSCHGRAEYQ